MPTDDVDAFFGAVGPTGTTGRGSDLVPELDDRAYLQRLADRVRLARARRGMSRRLLAEQSGLSERYIAMVESGSGNLSILLLRAIAGALGLSPVDLLIDRPEAPIDTLIARLTEAQLHDAHALLTRHFTVHAPPGRETRVALIGLRGAGKSTLGRMLAEARGVPFHELGHAVEREAKAALKDIFALHGQTGFRRLERDALERLLADAGPCVIAAGGGIVATPPTYNLLLRACRTIWVRASPDEHMRRVRAQGDLRPMRQTRSAMDDLRAILAAREPLYARADLVLDTTGQTLEASFAELLRLAG